METDPHLDQILSSICFFCLNIRIVWKDIFVWYNAAMMDKILKNISHIVINTNYLLLVSSSNVPEGKIQY